MAKVLNVGGSSKNIPIPDIYLGWEHILLDVDPRFKPDRVLDARMLEMLPPAQYDAVYCAHNLEHFYRHDALKVLRGFHNVLTPDGFAHIVVPDIGELFQIVARNNLDMGDVLYQSPAGPVTVCDMIYGYGPQMERSGQDFLAHKNGFTEKSLVSLVLSAGFAQVFSNTGKLEIQAFAFKERPTESKIKWLNLKLSGGAP